MIWVDITNSPHVLFFEEFIKKHDVFVTTRDFGILTELLDAHGVNYLTVGKHGRGKEEKLVQSSSRILKLSKIVAEEGIALGIAKHSVELPRVSFGLGIPCIQIVDNEFAEHQNRLTLSLCSRLVVPKALDTGRLLIQGARRDKISRFDGLCEAVHIRNFKPDARPVKENYILLRPEPLSAAYFTGSSRTQEVIDALGRLDRKILVIPRANEKYKNACPVKSTDSLNLLYHADAFVGGGGTMSRESALLGTPAVSYYPQELLGVDRFLIGQKLMYHATSRTEILELVGNLINKKQEQRKKAKALVKKLEDPFECIEREISNLTAL